MKVENFGSFQIFSLVLLRILIGWHVLYEGIAKLLNPTWSAASYLENAQGPLANYFIQLAENNRALFLIDFFNEWGLICIGLSLVLGFFTRIGISAGIVLLSLYYIAYPPFVGIEQAYNVEGNYLIVNKNLIEVGALFVLLVFPTSYIYGLDRFFKQSR